MFFRGYRIELISLNKLKIQIESGEDHLKSLYKVDTSAFQKSAQQRTTYHKF